MRIFALTGSLFAGATLFAGVAFAKLPPLTDAAKAQAAETAAKSAWTDKVAGYQLCVAMDRTANAYRRRLAVGGKEAPAPTATPPCADPGPYVAQVTLPPKPLEASGAHSPPETAVAPPGSRATAAEIAGGIKK